MITTSEILKYMESGQPFSCSVVAFDKRRKTGGKVKEYPEAILTQRTKGDRAPTKMEAQRLELERLRKNPNHREHYTRNITILQQGRKTSIIASIHIPLIVKFNGDTEVFP